MNQKILIAAAAIAVIVIGGLYYYGGYGTPSQPASPVVETPDSNGAYPVLIKNFAFSPAVLSIKAGDTVIWTNNDSSLHSVSGIGFESNDMGNGQSYSYTFNSNGTFDYICKTHPSMKGQIIVK